MIGGESNVGERQRGHARGEIRPGRLPGGFQSLDELNEPSLAYGGEQIRFIGKMTICGHAGYANASSDLA
jgi:hypothetical protein